MNWETINGTRVYVTDEYYKALGHLITIEMRHWKVTIKRATSNRPSIHRVMADNLDAVRKFFQLDKPGIEYFKIEEEKE